MKHSLADQLRKIRTLRGYTQRALSHASGINSTQLSNFEHGSRLPSVENLGKLAQALEVSTDFLLGRTGQMIVVFADETRTARLINACEGLTTAQLAALLAVAVAMGTERRKCQNSDG
jgi:transcriptional regulator with XRE-family HTH domain